MPSCLGDLSLVRELSYYAAVGMVNRANVLRQFPPALKIMCDFRPPRRLLSNFMNVVLIILILLLLFGGGGFYYGGPMVGGGIGGLVLIVLIGYFLMGRRV
jgi:hypothetical protein